MKVALPVWNGRVSPVFDAATRMLIVEMGEGGEVARREELIGDTLAPRRAWRLRELGVNVLLCGAISRPLSAMLAGAGITVVPFVTGEVEEVLSAYLTGAIAEPQYLMPGCGGRRMRHRGGRGPWR